MTHRHLEMNQHDALYRIARAYPGGIEALAARMGKSPNTLRNKLRPEIATHAMSFEEVSEVLEFCEGAKVKDALQPLRAFNARHGMAAFRMPEVDDQDDEQLLGTVYRVMKEIGQVAETVSVALEDGRITVQELDLIEKNFAQGMSALGEWRERVRQRAERDGALQAQKKAAKGR